MTNTAFNDEELFHLNMIRTDDMNVDDAPLSDVSSTVSPKSPVNNTIAIGAVNPPADYGKSAINGWSQYKAPRMSSTLPYIPPPDVYTHVDAAKGDKDAKQKRKRVPPPAVHDHLHIDENKQNISPNIGALSNGAATTTKKGNSPKKSSTKSASNDIVSELMKQGFNRQDVLQCIREVELRMSWDIDSITLIYSRRKKKWFEGQVIDICVKEETKEKWLTVKYNNGYTKKMQNLNKNIKPIDLPYSSNQKLLQTICKKLKSNEITPQRLKRIQNKAATANHEKKRNPMKNGVVKSKGNINK